VVDDLDECADIGKIIVHPRPLPRRSITSMIGISGARRNGPDPFRSFERPVRDQLARHAGFGRLVCTAPDYERVIK
jgi:hypothetical protein